jgi:hypothetical protein
MAAADAAGPQGPGELLPAAQLLELPNAVLHEIGQWLDLQDCANCLLVGRRVAEVAKVTSIRPMKGRECAAAPNAAHSARAGDAIEPCCLAVPLGCRRGGVAPQDGQTFPVSGAPARLSCAMRAHSARPCSQRRHAGVRGTSCHAPPATLGCVSGGSRHCSAATRPAAASAIAEFGRSFRGMRPAFPIPLPPPSPLLPPPAQVPVPPLPPLGARVLPLQQRQAVRRLPAAEQPDRPRRRLPPPAEPDPPQC